MSWEVIIPFLRPIKPLILDPEISDIMVKGPDRIFIEKFGKLERVPGVSLSEKALQVAIRNIARRLGDDISEEKPILDARLPDGSRPTAVIAPCSVKGTTLAIRKFQSHLYKPEDLVRIGTLTPELLLQLRTAVECGKNILISGGCGNGKTALLNALSKFIPPEQRVIVIEDTAEIQTEQENLVRLEARREQPGLPAVPIRELLQAALRLRPDRIVVGEIRGGEAFDFLQALNTGHSGSMSTIHGSSAAEALTRFGTCVLMSGIVCLILRVLIKEQLSRITNAMYLACTAYCHRMWAPWMNRWNGGRRLPPQCAMSTEYSRRRRRSRWSGKRGSADPGNQWRPD